MSPSGLPIPIQTPNSPTTFAYPGHIKKTHHFLDCDPAVRYDGLGDGLNFSLGLLDDLPAMNVGLEELDEEYAKTEGREPAFGGRRRSTSSDTVTDDNVQINHTLGKSGGPPHLSATGNNANIAAGTIPSAVNTDPLYHNFANQLPMFQQQHPVLSNPQTLSQSSLLLQSAGNAAPVSGGYGQGNDPWHRGDPLLDASARQDFIHPMKVQGASFYPSSGNLYQPHRGLAGTTDSFDPSLSFRLSNDGFIPSTQSTIASSGSPNATPPYSPDGVIPSHTPFSLPFKDADRPGSTSASPTQSLKRSTPESETMDYYGPQLSSSAYNPHYPGNQHKPPHPSAAHMMRAGSPPSSIRKRTRYDSLPKQQQIQLQQAAIGMAADCAQQRLGPLPVPPSKYPTMIHIEPQHDAMRAQQQIDATNSSQPLGASLESPLNTSHQPNNAVYPIDQSALLNWNALVAAQGMAPPPAMMQAGWNIAPPPPTMSDHSSSPSPHNEVSSINSNKFYGPTGVISHPQPIRRATLHPSLGRGSLPGNYAAMPDSETLQGLYKPSTPITSSPNPSNYNPTTHHPRQMAMIPPNHAGRRGSLTLQHHAPGIPGTSGNIGPPHQQPARRVSGTSGASPYQQQQHHQVPQHRPSSDVYMS